MIAEALRLTSAWLQHGTYGLNAQLAAVPRDAGDPQPANFTVFATEVDHEDAALGRLPTAAPAVVITVESANVVNDEAAHEIGDGSVVLNVRLSVTADADAKDMKRDASYSLRALMWCFRKWVVQDVNATTRKKNSVAILEIGRCEFNSLYETVDDRIVTGGARVPLTVRDVGLT